MITIPESPNIGEMLKTYIKTNRKYKSGIANWLGIGQSSVQGFTKRPDMKVSTLWRLCHVLKYNFFEEITAQLPAEFTAVTENPLQARITELEKQKSDLELQVKTLEKAIELMGRK
jgi:DNA-binding MurR/RpiR family transcriptional regulator